MVRGSTPAGGIIIIIIIIIIQYYKSNRSLGECVRYVC